MGSRGSGHWITPTLQVLAPSSWDPVVRCVATTAMLRSRDETDRLVARDRLRGPRARIAREGGGWTDVVRMLSGLLVQEARTQHVPVGIPPLPSQPGAGGLEEGPT